MVSALVSGSSGPGSSPGRGHCVVFLARHVTLTVPLSTRAYKWVPANLMLGVTLRRTSIPSRGEQKYSQSLHATETGISSGLMGHLARMQTLLCLTENNYIISLLFNLLQHTRLPAPFRTNCRQDKLPGIGSYNKDGCIHQCTANLTLRQCGCRGIGLQGQMTP